ncbi:hypothetical protein ES703_74897 [subsurface metagenome]
MKQENKPKVVLVPFGYPDYPRELLEKFTNESQQLIAQLGTRVETTPIVITLEDIEPVRRHLYEFNPEVIIALILSWMEAPNFMAVLGDYLHRPLLLWSHTRFRENEKLLTLGALDGAAPIRQTLEELRARFSFIWGMPDEDQVKKHIDRFTSAAYAEYLLSHARIGLLGYASMGMYTGTFSHVNLRKKLGPEIDHLDQYVLIKAAEEISDEQVLSLVQKVKQEWELEPTVRDETIQTAMKMYTALRQLANKFKWDALTVKCQYELSKYYKNTPCVPLSMLSGEMTCSCEGDILLLVTQLLLHYLSNDVVTYGDVHNIEKKSVVLGACGFAPFVMGEGKPEVSRHTALYDGLSNSTVYKEGPVTIARIGATAEGGYKMHIETGFARHPEPFREVGCTTYPSMEVDLDGDGIHFGQNLMSQHYAVVYGDVKDKVLEFCKLKGMPVVTSR